MAGALSHVKEFTKDYSFICHNAVTHRVNTIYLK